LTTQLLIVDPHARTSRLVLGSQPEQMSVAGVISA